MVLIGDGVALASDIFLDHRCADNMSGEVVLKERMRSCRLRASGIAPTKKSMVFVDRRSLPPEECIVEPRKSIFDTATLYSALHRLSDEVSLRGYNALVIIVTVTSTQ
jgi:hypothetical protein